MAASVEVGAGSGRTRLAPPSDEELAAIVAAIELTWPKPVVAEPGDGRPPTPRWRFSGRWWVKPIPARRDRPF